MNTLLTHYPAKVNEYNLYIRSYGVIFSSRGRFDNSLKSLTSKLYPLFCNLSSDTLLIADIDNDGKGDLVCRIADGSIQIILNSYSD